MWIRQRTHRALWLDPCFTIECCAPLLAKTIAFPTGSASHWLADDRLAMIHDSAILPHCGPFVAKMRKDAWLLEAAITDAPNVRSATKDICGEEYEVRMNARRGFNKSRIA